MSNRKKSLRALHIERNRLRKRKVERLLLGKTAGYTDQALAHVEQQIADFNKPPYLFRPKKVKKNERTDAHAAAGYAAHQ